jgi:hypothetical protein
MGSPCFFTDIVVGRKTLNRLPCFTLLMISMSIPSSAGKCRYMWHILAVKHGEMITGHTSNARQTKPWVFHSGVSPFETLLVYRVHICIRAYAERTRRDTIQR